VKLLVLTSEALNPKDLRDALPQGLDPADTEVMVVAPALQDSPLKFWMSDADEAIAKAEQVSKTTVEQLGRDGVSAAGDTGESDPVKAIEDALSTFDAQRILVFKHPRGEQAYREDLDVGELRERFGRPVDEASV
jgi:hypothetical protein